MKTGYYEGNSYISDTKPKGTGKKDVPFDARLYDLANYVYYNSETAHPDSVDVLQKELLKIGYLDEKNPQSNDGHIGRMTRGGAYRYMLNFDWESIKHNFNDMIFGSEKKK